MILVTIGGVKEFDFSRLLRIIDEIITDRVIKGEEVIVQRGFSKYVPKNCQSFDFIDNEQFKSLELHSDFIISHGGIGTILPVLKQKKKVIIFPRLSIFGEHVDDHQLEFCQYCQKNNYALFATNKDELVKAITNINKFSPVRYESVQNNIDNIIIDLLERRR